MMMNAQKKDPKLVAQIQDMIESGMEPQKIADTLLEQAERVREGLPATKEEEQEYFPDEIIIASQALAYRDATSADVPIITRIINAAYEKEVSGKEAFRKGPGTVSAAQVSGMLEAGGASGDQVYQWVLLEVPCGMNIETDGTVLGVCCYTTDGVCRKNGEVEGKLGSIRYFAVTPRYHGVLIGHRFLKKVEDLLTRAGCCRVMVCVPDTRLSLVEWLMHEERGYTDVNSTPYPQQQDGEQDGGEGAHRLLPGKKNTTLVMFTKPLPPLPPPPRVPQTREEYARAATATFIGQDSHLDPDKEPDSQSHTSPSSVPMPPVANSHLPPHWREGVSSVGTTTTGPSLTTAAANKTDTATEHDETSNNSTISTSQIHDEEMPHDTRSDK